MEYGLIGGKLGHSYSKIIHEMLADYTYDLCPLTPEEFPKFMEAHEFRAINVTIPYKQDVIPYLDEIDAPARAIGAVNTIVNKNGKLCGHNTDYPGFRYMLQKNEIPVKDQICLVLGTGGASKAVVAVLRDMGASKVLLVSRHAAPGVVTYEEAIAEHTDAQVIVNTTPVGMYPDNDSSPLDLTPFTACHSVVDVVYNPTVTAIVAQARELGKKGITGLEMLVAQALYAIEFFLDTSLEEKKIQEVYEELLKQF